MISFACCAMVITLLFFSIGVSLCWIMMFLGHPEFLFELLDLPAESSIPPIWVSVFGVGLMGMTLAFMARAFWAIHLILANGGRLRFDDLGRQLRKCSIAFFGFWLCNWMVITLLPIVLVWPLPYEEWTEIEFLPLDIEL